MNNEQIQTAPPGENGFIDEKQLLARLPISRRTAFTWVQTGKLPCVKINRRKLFHWPSVEQALLRQQSTPVCPLR
jgi:predicted site-specific integrase-resolvase